MGNNAIKDTGRSIACKQLDLVYQRYSFSFVSSLLISSTLVAMLWPLVAHSVLLAWLLSLWSVMVARNYHARRYLRLMPDVDLGKWRSGLVAGAAAAGACWGLSVFFLSVSPLDPAALPLIFVIAGVSAFASGTMAAERRATMAFLLTALLPLALWLALSGDRLHVYMALITLAYTGLMLLFSCEIHRLIRNSLSTPEQNWQISAAIKQVRALEHAAARQESERCYSEQFANFEDNIFFLDFEEQGGFTVASINPAEERSFGLIDDEVRSLRKSETQFRTLAENAPDPIYRYDRDCRRIYVNPAVMKLSGQPLTSLLGKRPTEARLVPSDESVKVELSIQRVLDTGMPDEIEVLFVAPDGRELYFQNMHVPEFGEDGALESVLSIGRDITARKYMEEVLLKSEREYRTLSENSPDNIIRYDRECRIRYLNKNAATALALSAAYMLRKTSTEVFSDGLFDELELVLNGVIESGQPAEHYVVLPDRGEGECYQHLRMMPEKNERGEVTGVLSIGRDITERRNYENALLARVELEQRISSYINSAPGFFFSLCQTPEGDVSMPFASEGIKAIYGLQPEDVLDSVAAIVALDHPDDVAQKFSAMEKSGRTLLPCQVEFRVLNKEKGEIWVEARSMPKCDEDGTMHWHGFMQDITERKRMEQALAAREQEFRTLAENFPDVVVRYTPDFKRVYVNPALAELAGVPAGEMLGKSPQDITPLTDPEGYMAELRQVMQSGISSVREFSVRRTNGEAGWYMGSFVPEFDAGGSLVNVLMVARDITERKHMQEELVVREREFRSLAANMPDNVARWDVQGRYLYINPVHERTLGVSASELIGTSIPDTHEHVKAAIAQVVATGQVVELIRQLVPVNGEIQIHEVSLVPERDAAGRIVSVLGLGRNMTEFYRLQDAIVAREQEFRSLAENLPVAVIRYDGECKRRYLNRAAERMLHGSAAELLGQVPGAGSVPALPAMIEHYRGKLEEVLVTGAERELDFVLDALPADRQEHFEVRFVPEQGADGHTTGVLAIWYDVTEREAMEQVLRDSESMLQEAQHIAHVGSWDVDVVNDVLTWSDEIFRIWEIDKAQFAGTFAAFLATVHPEDRERVDRIYNESVVNHSRYELEHRLLLPDGRVKHILEQGEPQYDAQGKPVRFIGTSLDITERKFAQQYEQFRSRTLELLAGNHALPAILGEIVQGVEQLNSKMLCSILLLDSQGKHLVEGVAPSLPDFYNEAINGMEIGMGAGSCGTAAASGERVIVEDIQTHPYWVPFKELAARAGLGACWSQPVRASSGKVLGTFAIYHRAAHAPTVQDISLIEKIAHMASIAIERKRMEAELAAREQEFRALVDQAPEPIFRYAPDGRRIYANAVVERIAGIPASVLLGGLSADGKVVPADSGAAITALVKRICETGEPGEIEVENVGADGRLRYFHNRLAPEFGADGKVRSVFSICHDITERKLAEQSLEKTHWLLRNVLQGIPDPVWMKDADGAFVVCNQGVARLFNKKEEEIIGKTDYDFFDAEMAEFYQNKDRAALESEDGAINEEWWTFGDNGEQALMETRKVPVRSPEGKLLGVLGVARDITARKQAETTLQERLERINELNDHLEVYARDMEEHAVELEASQEQLKDALDFTEGVINAIPDLLFELDADGRYLSVWTQNSALLVEQKAYLLGKTLREVLTPDAAEVGMAALREAGEKGISLGKTIRIDLPRGTNWFELSVSRKPGDTPDDTHFLMLSRNITERKRNEEVLEFIAQGEWLSGGEAFLPALVRYLGKTLGVDYVVIDRLAADTAYVETMALYAKEEILPNMQYALQGTPCGEVMAGKACCYADDVRGLFPESGVLAKMQAESYVGVPLLNVEGRVIGLIAALDSLPMADAHAVKSVLKLVATSAAAELVRSQMEGVLRHSHASLSEAQRISRVGNWELDLASGALLWSDEIYRIFEIDPAQFGASYEAFLNAIHPDDREAVSQAYRESLESRAPYQIEHRLSMADGRIKYVHEHCETLYAADGRPLRSTGTVQDITERKRAEEALRVSEEKVRSLFELSPLGIALTDMQGRYVEFNEAFRAICGYPSDELMTLDYWTLTPKAYEAKETEQLESLSRTGRYGPYEKEYRQKDGRRIPIQLSGVLVAGCDGQQYIWSIVEDITERKRSEALLTERLAYIHGLNLHLEENARHLEEQTVELEASQVQIKQTEEWYRSILHSAPDGMMVVDDRGVIMQVNERLAAMFGYDESELSGRDLEMLLPRALRESHVGMRNGFLARKDGYRDAMVGKALFGCRKDGTEFPVDVSLSRLPEIEGRRRAICASVRDVSERYAMEMAREAALAEALRLAQLRSSFMAQMSHELRTPLNGILGHAQNLLHGGALGEKQIGGLNIIQHSGEHLLAIINGILDHAAIEADKFELIPGDIQLETFLATIIGIIRIRVEQKNLGFSCVAAANLPAVVRGDAQRLRQVLINLLANAVKFTDRGQVSLRVDYTAPQRLRFAVQDSGVGIAADQLENIFLPFEQIGEIRRRAGGTGLGLAISRELVSLMGGAIEVESQPGAGSTFWFEIEMENEPSDSARVNAAALSEQAETRVAQATMTLPVPPRQELNILHGLALRGSMRDIMRHAEKLAEADGLYLPFVEQLRQLAKNFQTKALLSLIEQYRKGTKQ